MRTNIKRHANTSSKSKSSLHRSRLGLECLEDRLAPATSLLWIGPQDGEPMTKDFWAKSTGGTKIPENGDSLLFKPGQGWGGGTGTNTSPKAFKAGMSFANITLDTGYGGDVGFKLNPTTYDTVTTVTGTLALMSGTISTTGLSILSVANSTWTGGTWSALTDLTGSMTISNATNPVTLKNLLNVYGTVEWISPANPNQPGGILLDTGYFSVKTGGNFNIKTDSTLNRSMGSLGALYTEGGTVTKTSTGITTIGASFYNSGILKIDAGTLAFTGHAEQNASETDMPLTEFKNTSGVQMTFANRYWLNSGTLKGSGLITGNVDVYNATIHPATGVDLKIVGNLTMSQFTKLKVDISGTVNDIKTSKLTVTGTLVLDGFLEAKRNVLTFLDPETPAAALTFLEWGTLDTASSTDFNISPFIENNSWRWELRDYCLSSIRDLPGKNYRFEVVRDFRNWVRGDVWGDADAGGTRGLGEAGISATVVRLLNAANDVLATTTTDAQGTYEFDTTVVGSGPSGTYRVEFVAPSGKIFALRDQGGNDAKDSDVYKSGRSDTFSLTDNTIIDAGLVAVGSSLAAVSGSVWADDGGGLRESDEAAVPGVPVSLIDADGAVVATAATDSAGDYVFSGRDQGFYRVRFGLPSGATGFTSPDVGADAIDSDADSAGDTAFALLGAAGLDLDAGVLGLASAAVSGRVWDDADSDGVQDSGESGVSAVTVRLRNSANAVVATATTTAGGLYSLAGLAGTSYRVEVVAPSAKIFSLRDQGGNDAVDSDVDKVGRSALFTLTDDDVTIDAGLVAVGTGTIDLGGSVWADDGDGVRELGEAAVAGVLVYLIDADGNVVDSTYTDSAGDYVFEDLARGFYRLDFELPAGYATFTQQNAGSDDGLDSDVDSSGLTAFTLFDGNGDEDAGLRAAGIIIIGMD